MGSVGFSPVDVVVEGGVAETGFSFVEEEEDCKNGCKKRKIEKSCKKKCSFMYGHSNGRCPGFKSSRAVAGISFHRARTFCSCPHSIFASTKFYRYEASE